MKIQRIKLENFRSYPSLELELAQRITVIRGANHQGKSSIEQAIQYGLAARSEGTNAAGAGYEETLMRNGADLSRIFLDLEFEGELRKLRASISRKNGRTIATKDVDGADTTQVMNPWLRGNADLISCLTNSRYFVDLDPAKQKDILSGIVLPKTYDDWDAAMVDAGKTVGIDVTAWMDTHPFTVIGSTYDQAFEMRKNVNRDLKNFVTPNADIADAGDVEEIRARLQERRKELTAVQNKRASMLAEATATIGKREVTLKRIRDAEWKIAEENKTLTEYQAKVLDKKALKSNRDLAAQAKNAADLDAKILKTETELVGIDKARKKCLELPEACPTCTQPVSDIHREVIMKPLDDRWTELNEDLRVAKEARASIGEFTLAAQALKDHETAEKEIMRTTERLKEAQTDLSGANTDLEAIGEAAAVDTSEVDAQIEDLTRRIETGSGRLSAVSAANERKKAYDDAVERLGKLKEKSGLLEKLVAYFGPTGIQAKLLQDHVGAFVASMNAVLVAWGYECRLSFDPEFFFGIVTMVPDSDIVRTWSMRTLSKSERYRFAIAFQVALAMHTGFRFVVIDEMDMLDREGRSGLMQKIINSELDHAILLGTDERDSISAGMAETADFFMVTSSLVEGIPTSSVARIHAAV